MLALLTTAGAVLIAWAVTAQSKGQSGEQAKAEITIIVPANAEVFFDGKPTKEKGTERVFLTPPLEVGEKYSYELRARWQEGGKVVERTRKIKVSAGARVRVDFLAPPPPLSQQPGGQGKDQIEKADPKEGAAIQKQGQAFVEAFQNGDAKGVAALWVEDGTYLPLTGPKLQGRDAIAKAFTDFFARNKGLKVAIKSETLRFITPEVAVEEGVSEVFPPDGGPPSRARFSNIHVKKNGQWLLSRVKDSEFTPPSNYGRLRGLEWAVGEWASDGSNGAVEHISLAWNDTRNFITGTFSTTVKNVSVGSAKKWIGWDPLARQVRSWSFDDSGAFGEGSWSQEGDKWVVKSSTVLPDGKKLTATYTIAPVNEDTITREARDRRVDGNALPDLKEVKLKRIK
jgi:uncharacterized protein (TIGR02246 family)